ncbi:MAG: TraB/GumN family protein [bacterium]
MRCFITLALACMAPLVAQAECVGENLIASLPPAQLAPLRAATDATPFAKGNLWHATRAGQDITLVGTFHLDDPRHVATMTALTPALSQAKALLVEAGPAEETALKAQVADHPERLVNRTGPTLPEVLSDRDWARLSDALRARGIPPFFAAKLQPWYLTAVLAVPACQFDPTEIPNGLDRRLMAYAADHDLAVQALEPFDTIFKIFDSFSPKDQVLMLTQTLDASDQDAAMAVTLSDSYFAGDSRLFWEFSKWQVMISPNTAPEEAKRQFDLVDAALVNRRNVTWIPVIEAAAAQGPIVVAFGALHLSGEQGVLNLLKRDGWKIEPLP